MLANRFIKKTPVNLTLDECKTIESIFIELCETEDEMSEEEKRTLSKIRLIRSLIEKAIAFRKETSRLRDLGSARL